MSEETIVSASEAAGLVDDILSTTELEAPRAVPEAHRGEINGVTVERFDNEKGTVALNVHLKSLDVPALDSENYRIFLPKGFADNIFVDPNTLPSEEGNDQRKQYSIGISNTDKTATIQELRRIAYEQNRSTQGLEPPTDIDSFAGVLSQLFTGVEVIFTRRPDTKAEDPRFRNKLRVTSILNPNVRHNPKALKKYVKMWEQQS